MSNASRRKKKKRSRRRWRRTNTSTKKPCQIVVLSVVHGPSKHTTYSVTYPKPQCLLIHKTIIVDDDDIGYIGFLWMCLYWKSAVCVIFEAFGARMKLCILRSVRGSTNIKFIGWKWYMCSMTCISSPKRKRSQAWARAISRSRLTQNYTPPSASSCIIIAMYIYIYI